MQLPYEMGPVKPFENRQFRNIDENLIWKEFMQRGQKFREILKEKKPEIADAIIKIIEKEERERAEKEAKQKELEDRGMWVENPADGAYYWTGIEPPGPENPHPDDMESEPEKLDWGPGYVSEYTDDEWDELQFKWYCETMKERRKEDKEARNKKAREKYQALKDQLLEPIIIPEMELSEYEKIREQNIKERNEALIAAGWLKMK